MIFYFSGTGNSKHAALSMGDAHAINVANAIKNNEYEYTLEAGEAVGFAYPVYYSSLPKSMLDFVRKVKINGDITYMYALVTSGGGPGGSGYILQRELKKNGYKLDAYFHVRMPSNYIFMSSLADDASEFNKIIMDAEPVLESIAADVNNRKCTNPHWSAIDKFLSFIMYPLSDRYMSAKKFYADDTCTGCGGCAAKCPLSSITMTDGKPKWTQNKCERCMACVSCSSVQYGNSIKNKSRYFYKKVNLEK